MVEDAKPCIDIMQQTRAAEAAIRKLSVTIFRAYVHTYLMAPAAQESTENRMAFEELHAILADRFKAAD